VSPMARSVTWRMAQLRALMRGSRLVARGVSPMLDEHTGAARLLVSYLVEAAAAAAEHAIGITLHAPQASISYTSLIRQALSRHPHSHPPVIFRALLSHLVSSFRLHPSLLPSTS
jgi:hypothetical protein